MNKTLRNCAIAGIFSGVFAIPLIIYGILKEVKKLGNTALSIAAIIVYVAISVYFLWGFKIIGDKTKNKLLSISTLLVIISTVLVYGIDLIPYKMEGLMSLFVGIGTLILIGVITIIFGVALLRLKKQLGPLATVNGVLNIIAGVSFVTIILFFIPYILLIPSIVLEVILMFKAAEKF